MKPAKQVRVAAKLRKLADLWKGGVKIAQKAASHVLVVGDCVGTQSQGKSLNMSLENLIE
jgi:hypothetical protein